ncbi:hypothetical protein PR048_020164 [Dryococelus australis]|uniref:PiggyBac transposable element-derived protein domain-containing protein n=1 Tax=Dryococelus australis TaxID=614101 RepID=A0ABQ9H5I7_9NEOP|nr:hypothetical protein PR048_020164 [Dryococelus australis]
MIPIKGRSCLNKYMPLKPVKRCYKVWCLADSVTGFVLEFEIYSGKTDSSDDLQLGERVALHFCIKGPIAAVKWQNSKPVTVLFSATSPKDTTSVRRKNKYGKKTTVSCPTAIQMGGVDINDHLREQYVGRRVTGDLDRKSFRIPLSRQLIYGYTSKKWRCRPPLFIAKRIESIGVPHGVCSMNVDEHLPEKNIKYRRCRLCS